MKCWGGGWRTRPLSSGTTSGTSCWVWRTRLRAIPSSSPTSTAWLKTPTATKGTQHGTTEQCSSSWFCLNSYKSAQMNCSCSCNWNQTFSTPLCLGCRTLASDFLNLKSVDGMDEWRKKESQQLTDLVQRRFHYLQVTPPGLPLSSTAQGCNYPSDSTISGQYSLRAVPSHDIDLLLNWIYCFSTLQVCLEKYLNAFGITSWIRLLSRATEDYELDFWEMVESC